MCINEYNNNNDMEYMKKRLRLWLLCLMMTIAGPITAQTKYTPDPTGYTPLPSGYRTLNGTKYYGGYPDETNYDFYIQARAVDNGDGTVTFYVRKSNGTFLKDASFYIIKDPSVTGGVVFSTPDVVPGSMGSISAGKREDKVTITPGFTSGSHNYCVLLTTSYHFFTKSIKLTATTQKLATPSYGSFSATSVLYNGFTANWDAVKGATGYRINVRRASEDYENSIVFKQTTNTNSYKVTGLKGNGYQFQVQATVGSDESVWSDWSKSSDIIRTLSNMSITSGNTFGSSTLLKGREYTYKVTIKNNSSYDWFGSFYLKGAEEEFPWNSYLIKAGQSETFTHKHTFTTTGTKTMQLYVQQGARGEGETFGSSFTVNVVNQINPTTPTVISPKDGATGVATSGTLKWSTSANDNEGILSYDLYLGTDKNNLKLYKGSGTSYTYSNLTAGATYYWKVIAYNGSNGNATSELWSFTTAGGTPSGDEMTAAQAAQYLYDKGVIEDKDVDSNILRKQLAKIAFRGLYSTNGRTIPNSVISDNFPTVYEDLATQTSENSYYYQAARALLYLEYGDGVTPFDRNRLNFDPGNTIQRINVLKVYMEAFNIQPKMSGSNYFTNEDDMVQLASRDPRKYGYIRKAAELKIINTTISKWRPYEPCTRGEAFLMLIRIMEKLKDGTITNPNPNDNAYFQPLNTTMKTISLGADLQMGNFNHYTKTSFALGGVAPLDFTHTYNSYNTTLPEVFYGCNDQREAYLPLADGWSHSYHTFITSVDNHVIVHWGGGSIDVYGSDGSGWKPLSIGVYDQLTTSSNTFVIKTKSQVSYYFGTKKSGVAYLSKIVDRNGNKVEIAYQTGNDGMPRIKTVTSSDVNGSGSRSLTFSYGISGTDLVTSVSDPLGRSISFGYDYNNYTGRYQLTSFTDAERNKTTYEYVDDTKLSTSKLLASIRLPKGNYITNTYNVNNRRLTQTENGDTKTVINVTPSYGSSMSTTSTVDITRYGSTTSRYSYQFDANNMVTNMTGPNQLKVNNTYYTDATKVHLPKTITTNSTNISNITYDGNGNVKSVSVKGDGKTLTTYYEYNTDNTLKSVKDPKGYTTTYSYDSKGNLTGVSAPEGVSSTISVNTNGLPKKVTNAENVSVEYGYDSYGNLNKVTMPLSIISYPEYDVAGRLESMKDALGRTTSFTYDTNDNVKSSTDPENHTTQYDYDSNDNLTGITNAKGGETSMSYDYDTDLLTSVSFAGASKEYSYNSDGTLDHFTKPDGTTLSYSYDNLGRVTDDGINTYGYDSQTLRLNSVTDKDSGKILSLSYDGFGRVTSTSYNGHSNGYSYDDNGNCTNVNNTAYGYDKLNRLTSVKFNGKTITYSYRKDNQLSEVNYSNGLMITTFGYDAAGRLTSKKTKVNGNIVASYSFELDKAGNITKQTAKEPYDGISLTNEDVSYSYNSGNRITSVGDISFSFDENGNTTMRGSEQYQWDDADRLTRAGSTTIKYDPLGHIASYGDITFTTDPLGISNVLSDSKGAEYIYGNGLEARVKNGKVSYYVTDVRGSVVAIVDESGNITHKYQYDEFGKVMQKQEADYNPFQYVGKYGVMYLSDHQYYMRARHYDPTIGRFLSEDPIWSTNLYPYTDNNPIMGIDPEGEATIRHRPLGVNNIFDVALGTIDSRYVLTQNSLFDTANTQYFHEQIFFDEPVYMYIPYYKKYMWVENIGYGTNANNIGEAVPLINEPSSWYFFSGEEKLSEKETVEAVKNLLPENFGEYDSITHNCQDYVDAIRTAVNGKGNSKETVNKIVTKVIIKMALGN